MASLCPSINYPLVPCRQCGKLFPDKQQAIAHSRKTHRIYLYCPNNCGYRALRKKNLRDHSKKCHLNGIPTSFQVLENLRKKGQLQYETAQAQPSQLAMGRDPMWSPQSPPPEADNFISEDNFEPIYPDLNEVVIQSKPIASTSMAKLAEKRDDGTRGDHIAETIRRVRAKVMALPVANFSHTIENPGTLEPGITSRRIITEFADLPSLGVYCIIYDEVELLRKEEE